MRKPALAAVVIAGALALGACSSDYKGLGDAGINKKLEEKRDVIVMPDQFANVAMACDGHGHRIYSTTRANATITVVSDPSCPGGE